MKRKTGRNIWRKREKLSSVCDAEDIKMGEWPRAIGKPSQNYKEINSMNEQKL